MNESGRVEYGGRQGRVAGLGRSLGWDSVDIFFFLYWMWIRWMWMGWMGGWVGEWNLGFHVAVLFGS